MGDEDEGLYSRNDDMGTPIYNCGPLEFDFSAPLPGWIVYDNLIIDAWKTWKDNYNSYASFRLRVSRRSSIYLANIIGPMSILCLGMFCSFLISYKDYWAR